MACRMPRQQPSANDLGDEGHGLILNLGESLLSRPINKPTAMRNQHCRRALDHAERHDNRIAPQMAIVC